MSELSFQALVKRICEEHERILALNDELTAEVSRLRPSRPAPESSTDVSQVSFGKFNPTRSKDSAELIRTVVRSQLARDPRSPRRAATSSAAKRLPLDLQLWPVWYSEDLNLKFLSMTKSHMTHKMRSKAGLLVHSLSDCTMTEHAHYRAGDVVREKDSVLQQLIMMPNSMAHALWDVASALCLCYDIVVIPLHACTPFPENDFMMAMGWLMAVFWTIDIPVSFFTGYRNGSLIEMRPIRVAKHYLRTWFLIDVPLVVGNWTFLLLGTTSRAIVGSARLSKFARLLRVARTLRLLRLGKVLSALTELSFFIWTQDLLAVLGIFKMLLGILVLNHYIACVWYAIGDFDGETWLSVFKAKYDGPKFAFIYTTALHWSITQFTPASMEVVPTGTFERVFAVAVIIFALVVFSTALAKITSTITRLREFHTEQNKRLDSMLQFFHANKLSSELGTRIYRFVVTYQKKKANRILETDVAAFQILPNTMLMEMHFEVFAPTLVKHPFIGMCEQTAHDLLFNICHHAASENHVRSGQEVFVAGNHATKMHFVLNGSLEYQHFSAAGKFESLPVCAGICCCEPVLWVQWTCKGRLSAESVSDLVDLDADLFCHMVASHEDVYVLGRECARLFQENLLRQVRSNKQLSDLLSDWDELVYTVQTAEASAHQIVMQSYEEDFTDFAVNSSVSSIVEENDEEALSSTRSYRSRVESV